MIRTLAMAAGLAVGASAANAAFLNASIVEGDSAAASAALGQAATVLQIYAVFDGPGSPQGTPSAQAINTVLSTSFVNITPNSGTFFDFLTLGPSDTAPNSALFGGFPTAEFDTFGTIGVADSLPGDTTSTEPGTAITATSVVGGWFNSQPPNLNGAASVDFGDGTFGTLLFQLTLIGLGEGGDTTSSVLTDLISGTMTIFEQGVGQAIAHEVTFIPTPGALALFGVAGLAATRRRR